MKYFLSLLLLAFCISSQADTLKKSSEEDEHTRQMDMYYEQARKVHEQQLETDRQLEASAGQLQEAARQQALTMKLIKDAEERAKREELLLIKHEEQARRYDAILEKWEAQLEVKEE
jgi:hypothetical protein